MYYMDVPEFSREEVVPSADVGSIEDSLEVSEHRQHVVVVQHGGDNSAPRDTASDNGVSACRGSTSKSSKSSGKRKTEKKTKTLSEERVLELIGGKFDELKSFFAQQQGVASGASSQEYTAAHHHDHRPTPPPRPTSSFTPVDNWDKPPVLAIDEDLGSLAGSPSRSWQQERFPGHAAARVSSMPMGRSMSMNQAQGSNGARSVFPLAQGQIGVTFPGAGLNVEDDSRSVVSIHSDISNKSDDSHDSAQSRMTALSSQDFKSGIEVPQSWVDLVSLVKSILPIPHFDDSDTEVGKSVLSGSFETALPSRKKATVLPADAVIEASWKEIFKTNSSSTSAANNNKNTGKSLKIASFKKKHKQYYRWPKKDFERLGKVPELDRAVTTYLASGKNRKGSFVPRALYPEETAADNALKDIDTSLRAAHRVMSHASYFLAGLSSVLSKSGVTPESEAGILLSGLAATLVDSADLTVRASARNVKARREIYLKAMNLPDARAKADLLKVTPLGGKLFAGQVEKITHESSELVRDIREAATNYGVLPKDKSKLPDRYAKRKATEHSSGQEQPFKRFKAFNDRGAKSQNSGRSGNFQRPFQPRQGNRAHSSGRASEGEKPSSAKF